MKEQADSKLFIGNTPVLYIFYKIVFDHNTRIVTIE